MVFLFVESSVLVVSCVVESNMESNTSAQCRHVFSTQKFRELKQFCRAKLFATFSSNQFTSLKTIARRTRVDATGFSKFNCAKIFYQPAMLASKHELISFAHARSHGISAADDG